MATLPKKSESCFFEKKHGKYQKKKQHRASVGLLLDRSNLDIGFPTILPRNKTFQTHDQDVLWGSRKNVDRFFAGS
jgi:hypothetical protein